MTLLGTGKSCHFKRDGSDSREKKKVLLAQARISLERIYRDIGVVIVINQINDIISVRGILFVKCNLR